MLSGRKLASISLVLGLAIFSYAEILTFKAFAEPTVEISPTCGPHEPGFNIVINANGFAPDSNVAWKMVNSNSRIPLYGYFGTNSTGGFNDVTFADDLPEDKYKMYFGDDTDNDGTFDIGAKRVYANVTIPCEN
jgi:hypothetical protein